MCIIVSFDTRSRSPTSINSPLDVARRQHCIYRGRLYNLLILYVHFFFLFCHTLWVRKKSNLLPSIPTHLTTLCTSQHHPLVYSRPLPTRRAFLVMCTYLPWRGVFNFFFGLSVSDQAEQNISDVLKDSVYYCYYYYFYYYCLLPFCSLAYYWSSFVIFWGGILSFSLFVACLLEAAGNRHMHAWVYECLYLTGLS